VDAVGQAFAVFKLGRLEGVDGAVDVSLPRRDSKAGPGHRGIAVVGDPFLSLAEASRRRDFTMNAMLFDPASGELHDLHGGRRDIEARRLRAVDPATFGEDPLRALRAVQLAARFELAVDPDTARLCASMPLRELPAERVWGEIQKLLLKARRPSIGLALLKQWNLLPTVAPELLPLEATPQDPAWHPEGDVWVHTLLVVDEAAKLIGDLDAPRALAVMLAALCHDLGKPPTTRFEDGRIRSRGHEEAGIPPTHALLDRWNVHGYLGYDVRAQAVALVAQHLKPGQLYDERERIWTGRSGVSRASASRCCCIAWRRPIAWGAPATSSRWRWTGSSSACASSTWPRSRPSRCSRDATSWHWGSRPGPRSGASCSSSTSASSTEPSRRPKKRSPRRGVASPRGADGHACAFPAPVGTTRSRRRISGKTSARRVDESEGAR
jgi:tRNA nucleotidyltransferase (CCA-adding enzyme)